MIKRLIEKELLPKGSFSACDLSGRYVLVWNSPKGGKFGFSLRDTTGLGSNEVLFTDPALLADIAKYYQQSTNRNTPLRLRKTNKEYPVEKIPAVIEGDFYIKKKYENAHDWINKAKGIVGATKILVADTWNNIDKADHLYICISAKRIIVSAGNSQMADNWTKGDLGDDIGQALFKVNKGNLVDVVKLQSAPGQAKEVVKKLNYFISQMSKDKYGTED